jgi:hypothetical protein
LAIYGWALLIERHYPHLSSAHSVLLRRGKDAVAAKHRGGLFRDKIIHNFMVRKKIDSVQSGKK